MRTRRQASPALPTSPPAVPAADAPTAPNTLPVPRRRRRRIILVVVAGVLLAVCFVPLPSWASMFGEENTTLVSMLAQLIHANKEMADLNDAASTIGNTAGNLLSTYQRVNAGIDEIQHYSFDSFVGDLKTDFYNQYPGFGQLEHASQALAHWDDTRTASPFTAYEAITAVVGDLSAPLRADVDAGRQRVDQELILKGEAAGGFAIAHSAESSTVDFDRELRQLGQMARTASPAQASQISARAAVIAAAQNSHMMRLLSRTVRFDSVDAALRYGDRIAARNSAYEARDFSVSVTQQALTPPVMIQFGEDN